jgi:hypothetical protein
MTNYSTASSMLNGAGIDIDADFYTLSSSQVETLLELARIQKYRQPKNANGSKARYFFAALQRDFKKG